MCFAHSKIRSHRLCHVHLSSLYMRAPSSTARRRSRCPLHQSTHHARPRALRSPEIVSAVSTRQAGCARAHDASIPLRARTSVPLHARTRPCLAFARIRHGDQSYSWACGYVALSFVPDCDGRAAGACVSIELVGLTEGWWGPVGCQRGP